MMALFNEAYTSRANLSFKRDSTIINNAVRQVKSFNNVFEEILLAANDLNVTKNKECL
jgi:hypothetical protein